MAPQQVGARWVGVVEAEEVGRREAVVVLVEDVVAGAACRSVPACNTKSKTGRPQLSNCSEAVKYIKWLMIRGRGREARWEAGEIITEA